MIVGCGSNDSRVVGVWNFKQIDKPAEKPGSDLENGITDFAFGLADAFLTKLSFEFKSDHTFTIDSQPMGAWSMDGNTITLIPNKDSTSKGGIDLHINSNPNSKNSGKLILSDDGKTLKIVGDDPSKGGVEFTKSAP
jgi:hypothetical protein